MSYLGRHTDTLADGWVWMNRLADVYGICAHLDGERNFANHVARMRADHAAA